MRLRSCLLTCLAAAIALILQPTVGALDDAKIAALIDAEHLGGLKLGLSAKAVLKQFGKPTKQGTLVKQEADGTWVQEWSYPAKGLSLIMSSGEKKDGAKTVASFTATSGCKLATARGIAIGSSASVLRKAYAAFESKEEGKPDMFVAGSIYGGIIFDIENGKVSRIFFGAAAE